MKRSLFERQKAEAEAKRAKEEAETAAVYDDFVKSFDDEGSGPTSATPSKPSNPSSIGRQHYTHPSQRSNGYDNHRRYDQGPGIGPAQGFSLKRAHSGARLANERNVEKHKERGIFAFEDAPNGPLSAATALGQQDKDELDAADALAAEKAAKKPTLKLSSLPPGTSQALIKSLIPSSLRVDAVRLVPPSGPGTSGSTERKSTSAIVTLGHDTPASDMDAAVSTLQNRYLGWGYYLSSARHLSSSNASNLTNVHSALTSRPFGAQAIAPSLGPSLSRAPPPGGRGGFAPPTSYAPGSAARSQQPTAQVKVVPPSSIKKLRLIHKTVEAVIAYGPEFEVLLMSRPEVQREERWAWIWDARSRGGIWYRWRIWQIRSGALSEKQAPRDQFGNTKPRTIFHGMAPWLDPEDELPYEFAINVRQLASDSAYNSDDELDSDEDGVDDRGKRRRVDGVQIENQGQENEQESYLNPMEKARLTSLLTSLPTTTGKLRRGDVARVMAFAIDHAGCGGEEVTEMLVANVLDPFNMRSADSRHADDRDVNEEAEKDTFDVNDEGPTKTDKKDKSASSLIGLYCILDVLSASSTSGVRGAWRYRSLFEQALLSHHVFAKLGRFEKDLAWGRLKVEKWRRSLHTVLNAWEAGNVFGSQGHQQMVQEFDDPPLTEKEKSIKQEEQMEKKTKNRLQSKWKTVDTTAGSQSPQVAPNAEPIANSADVLDGQPLEDLDGAPVDDLDGEPAEEVDRVAADGEPVPEASLEDLRGEDDLAGNRGTDSIEAEPAATADRQASESKSRVDASAAKRQRPKAVDMFADSDEET